MTMRRFLYYKFRSDRPQDDREVVFDIHAFTIEDADSYVKDHGGDPTKLGLTITHILPGEDFNGVTISKEKGTDCQEKNACEEICEEVRKEAADERGGKKENRRQVSARKGKSSIRKTKDASRKAK